MEQENTTEKKIVVQMKKKMIKVKKKLKKICWMFSKIEI